MESENQIEVLHENILSRQSSTTSEKAVINGFVIQDNYIPYELLTRIFCFLDLKELVVCQSVCIAWHDLIKEYVWKKKAELIFGQSFSSNKKIDWISYYSLCKNKSIYRNLLLSDKVSVGEDNDYKTIEFDKNENPPPINVIPFPEDVILNNRIHCCISSANRYPTQRRFCINLLKEGFTEKLLDYVQPIIKVSVWYCCKWDETNAEYLCSIKLMGVSSHDTDKTSYVMRATSFHRRLNDINRRGKWFEYTQEFRNYGEGLRKIKFYDEGIKEVAISASIKLLLPDS